MSNKSFTSYLKSSVLLLSMFFVSTIAVHAESSATATASKQQKKKQRVKTPPRSVANKHASQYRGNVIASTSEVPQLESTNPINIGIQVGVRSSITPKISTLSIDGLNKDWISIDSTKTTVSYFGDNKFVTGIKKDKEKDPQNTPNIFTNMSYNVGIQGEYGINMYEGGDASVYGGISIRSAQDSEAIYEAIIPKGTMTTYVANPTVNQLNVPQVSTEDMKMSGIIKTEVKPSIELNIGTNMKHLVSNSGGIYVFAGLGGQINIIPKNKINLTYTSIETENDSFTSQVLNSTFNKLTSTTEKTTFIGTLGITLGTGMQMSNSLDVAVEANIGYAFSNKQSIVFNLEKDIKDPIKINDNKVPIFLKTGKNQTEASNAKDLPNKVDVLMTKDKAIKFDFQYRTPVLGLGAKISFKIN